MPNCGHEDTDSPNEDETQVSGNEDNACVAYTGLHGEPAGTH